MGVSIEGRHAFTWRELSSMLQPRGEACVWLRHGHSFYPAPRVVGAGELCYVPSLLVRGRTLTVTEFIRQIESVVPDQALDSPARATIWHGIIVGVRHGADFIGRPSFVAPGDIVFEVTDELPDL